MFELLSRDRIIAQPGFNRWKVPPASIAIHLCIGSVYAWSIYNPPLTRLFGVVTPASGDWSLQDVTWVFSVAIVFLGLGYVSPVSTLIKWFPDRRGMATGMAIMGFGGGAMIGAPLKRYFIQKFYDAPEYLGTVDQVNLITEAGRRFVERAGEQLEVVVVGANEVAGMLVPGPEGVYVVGTGSAGVAQTFMVLGVLYFIVMLIAAFSYRLPAEGWKPEGWTPPADDAGSKKMITSHNVDIEEAMRTPQFYGLWIVLCMNVSAGIGVLGVASTMMSEIFGTTLPGIVDGAFAALYVSMISVFNMVGRFIWASSSDYIGRKNTYWVFFALGIVLYLSVPFSANQVSASPAVVWLVLFYAATMIIFTMYGGGFATIPAYLADIFGTKYVGGIHGRLLTAWSTAGVVGPLAITSLRESAVVRAIGDLVSRIDPAAFQARFGAGIDQLDALVAAQTVTIASLMEIAPAGTVDPTPGLYNNTMYLMAALLLIGLVANALMKPVAASHYLKD